LIEPTPGLAHGHFPSFPPPTESEADAELALTDPVCVLSFNACDPCGASGLTADITTIASVGGHPLAVVTGTYVRDTNRIFDHHRLDDEWVSEQARAVLEDLPVRAIKVGFVGSPEILTVIAEISTDYPDIPIISYMPDLSWWDSDQMDSTWMPSRSCCCLRPRCWWATTTRCGAGCCPTGNTAARPRPATWPWRPRRWKCLRAGDRHSPARPVRGQRADHAQSVLGSSKYELFDASFTAPVTPCRPRWRPCWPPATTWAPRPRKPWNTWTAAWMQAFAPAWATICPTAVLGQPKRTKTPKPPGRVTRPCNHCALEGFVMPP
jgi:hydroxymethylpyrimidine/phosphomethylpyrimidine kinase